MGKKIHDLLVLGKSFDCTKNKCATTFLGESSSSLFDYILPRLLLDDFIAKMVCSRPNNVLQTFDLWLREFCLAVKAPLSCKSEEALGLLLWTRCEVAAVTN